MRSSVVLATWSHCRRGKEAISPVQRCELDTQVCPLSPGVVCVSCRAKGNICYGRGIMNTCGGGGYIWSRSPWTLHVGCMGNTRKFILHIRYLWLSEHSQFPITLSRYPPWAMSMSIYQIHHNIVADWTWKSKNWWTKATIGLHCYLITKMCLIKALLGYSTKVTRNKEVRVPYYVSCYSIVLQY